MADISGAFEVDGLVKEKKNLEALMMSNPAMEKKVQALVRKVLATVKKSVADSAKWKMKTDPRKAYKAVKTAVYKRIFGGSVSILDKRRHGTMNLYEPPRKLKPGQRGGNRVPRSQRTEQVMSYQGADRAFILRFLNAGTDTRTAGTRGGRMSGNRGRITPRGFFSSSSHTAMMKAADELSALIDELVKKEMN